MELLIAIAALLLAGAAAPPAAHSLSAPLNCTDPARLCTSFLAFRPSPSATLTQILSMFDALPSDITSDVSSASDRLLFIRKNCSCLRSAHQYLANTTLTLPPSASGPSDPFVAAAYAGLQSPIPTSSTPRPARPGGVLALHLLCACSAGPWNYLLSYVLQPGDSVDSLSSRFGASMDSIETANSLPGPDYLSVGTVYYIPLDSAPGQPYDLTAPPTPAPAHAPPVDVFPDDTKHHSSRFPYGWVMGSLGAAIALIILAFVSCVSFRSSSCLSRNLSKDRDKFHILRNKSFCYASGSYFCCKSVDFRPPVAANANSNHSGVPKGEVVDAVAAVVGDDRTVQTGLAADAFDTDKPMMFTHEEIILSTDYFSDSNLLGHGKYGSVYYGILRDQEVAIKRMTATKTKEFMAELKVLCKVHHASLVELIGYAASEDELFLIYEYAQKGSLRSHLHDPQNKGQTSLSWISRVQIALDAARGLEYIHEHTKNHYVHRDIKTSNILLDGAFRAKISDFGVAKLVVKTDDGESSATRVVGTFGYLAPEYLCDGLATSKSDIYAFGVVLFELISGKEAITRAQGTVSTNSERRSLVSVMLGALRNSPNLMSMTSLKDCIDPNLMDLYPHDCAYKMAMLAKECVDDDPILRPNMNQVVISLSHILLSSVEWEATLAGNSQVFSGLVQGR